VHLDVRGAMHRVSCTELRKVLVAIDEKQRARNISDAFKGTVDTPLGCGSEALSALLPCVIVGTVVVTLLRSVSCVLHSFLEQKLVTTALQIECCSTIPWHQSMCTIAW
jgi:hypothetical protein